MISNKKTAKLAGLTYLLVVIFGVGAQIIRSRIFVAGDVVTTVNNIMSSQFLYRLGFVSDLLTMVCTLFLPLVLYKLLKEVNKQLAILMVILLITGVPINLINLLNYFASLHILSGAEYLAVFGSEHLQAQAMLFYDLYNNGYHIAQIFFGLWLLPLGLLVYKSGIVPKFWGILLVAGCFGHLIELLTLFLFPNLIIITYPGLIISVIAEIGFCLWLVIMGAKEKLPVTKQEVLL